MSTRDDLLASALETMPIDPDFAARVAKHARSELAPATEPTTPALRLRAAARGMLVPALLASAAAVRTTETLEAAVRIYDTAGVDKP